MRSRVGMDWENTYKCICTYEYCIRVYVDIYSMQYCIIGCIVYVHIGVYMFDSSDTCWLY